MRKFYIHIGYAKIPRGMLSPRAKGCRWTDTSTDLTRTLGGSGTIRIGYAREHPLEGVRPSSTTPAATAWGSGARKGPGC